MHPIKRSSKSLKATLAKSKGKLHYWEGNNYFDVTFPFSGPMREDSPEADHMPWDERYRFLLERASWGTLRSRVFRFSKLAKSFAGRCVELGFSDVLIPSVGLCVHPWLFADRSLTVVATDIARSALAALSEPSRWPRLYSRDAFERWDIATSASYATHGNPKHFEPMPELENRSVRESLRRHITFTQSDWEDLPLSDGSIDAIFATNALPRRSSSEQTGVLREWVRVVRPGGVMFIAQHNFSGDVDNVLQEFGCTQLNVLGGERPIPPDVTGFQTWYSSG